MQLLLGDSLTILKTLPSQSVQTCVTSPPYWGLRDYGTARWEGGDPNCQHNPQRPDGGARSNRALPLGRGGLYKAICARCGAKRIDQQIGLESTPEAYVDRMVVVFREVHRVLKSDGTLWLNLGDSYAGGGRGGDPKHLRVDNSAKSTVSSYRDIPPKNLVGIPWRVAFALQADGWYLRQDVIWHKPNPMPESVKDRCAKAHEYIFLLSKSRRYYIDAEAISEPIADSSIHRAHGRYDGDKAKRGVYAMGAASVIEQHRKIREGKSRRNKRSVWSVTTKPYEGAHFATFPPDLIRPCILAGAPTQHTVLDPFMGSGTTGYVARSLQRNFIGIELNPAYLKLAKERIGALGTASDQQSPQTTDDMEDVA